MTRDESFPPLDALTVDVRDYPSFTDWLDDAELRHSEIPTVERDSRKTGYGSDWTGASDFKTALKLAREGWPEGRDHVSRRSERFQTFVHASGRVEDRAPTLVTGVAGSMVNVGLYLAGEPESMMSWQMHDATAPVVELVLNITVSSSMGHQAIINRGAAACALVDLLELSGKRVEVTVALAVGTTTQEDDPRHKYIDYRVIVKHAQDPLQIDQLAFALAHPSSLRRIGFSIMETAPAGYRTALGIRQNGQYGTVTETPSARGKGDLYIGAMRHKGYGTALVNWASDYDADRWLRNVLIAQGVLDPDDA